MQPRCSRDAAEAPPRSRGAAREVEGKAAEREARRRCPRLPPPPLSAGRSPRQSKAYYDTFDVQTLGYRAPARDRAEIPSSGPRESRERAEREPRQSRDAAGREPRESRERAEMQPRCSRDTGRAACARDGAARSSAGGHLRRPLRLWDRHVVARGHSLRAVRRPLPAPGRVARRARGAGPSTLLPPAPRWSAHRRPLLA